LKVRLRWPAGDELADDMLLMEGWSGVECDTDVDEDLNDVGMAVFGGRCWREWCEKIVTVLMYFTCRRKLGSMFAVVTSLSYRKIGSWMSTLGD